MICSIASTRIEAEVFLKCGGHFYRLLRIFSRELSYHVNLKESDLSFTSGTNRFWFSVYQDQLKRIKHTSASGESENGIGSLANNTRILPPSYPLHCPANSKYTFLNMILSDLVLKYIFKHMYIDKLPSLDLVYNEIYQRKPDGFIPDPKHRNLLFYAFYQYFVLQFFNSDFSSMV